MCTYDNKIQRIIERKFLGLKERELRVINARPSGRVLALSPPIPLMLVKFLVPFQLAFFADASSNSAIVFVQTAHLIDDDLQLQNHQEIEPHLQNRSFASVFAE